MADEELKSAFDARKSYSAVVERALMEEKLMANTGDAYRWARSLSTLLSLVVAYIPPEKAEAIVERLNKAQNQAGSMGTNNKLRASMSVRLDQELRGIEYEIHRLAGSFFWPTATKDSGEFNEKEFMEGSDL